MNDFDRSFEVQTNNFGVFKEVENEEFLLTASYDELMSEAVKQHNHRNYQAALAMRETAYLIARDESKSGRAARDIAASYERMARHGQEDTETKLSYFDKADYWLGIAFDMHDKVVKNSPEPSREALRERAATEGYIVIRGLDSAIKARSIGVKNQEVEAKTLNYAHQLTQDLDDSKKQAAGINKYVDQYEINMTGRASIAESLLGDRKRGLVLAAKAVTKSVFSESPLLDTSRPNLTMRERLGAKKKAFVRGIGALAVNVLVPTKYADKIANFII